MSVERGVSLTIYISTYSFSLSEKSICLSWGARVAEVCDYSNTGFSLD